MTHKDAPPRTDEQAAFEAFWIERKRAGFVGFSRDKYGEYHAEFARDAFAAWQAARDKLIAEQEKVAVAHLTIDDDDVQSCVDRQSAAFTAGLTSFNGMRRALETFVARAKPRPSTDRIAARGVVSDGTDPLDIIRHRATWIRDITSDPGMKLSAQENDRIHRFGADICAALETYETGRVAAQGGDVSDALIAQWADDTVKEWDARGDMIQYSFNFRGLIADGIRKALRAPTADGDSR
jgi:hypothetical protein